MGGRLFLEWFCRAGDAGSRLQYSTF